MTTHDMIAGDDQAGLALRLGGRSMIARPTGSLWRPDDALLVVSDLHLGKSERLARRGGPFLPPYDTTETLRRLGSEIRALAPRTVVCLGDSFDDSQAAAALSPKDVARLAALQSGRRWVWIAGNHDPAPGLNGGAAARVASELREDGLAMRHIARERDGAAETTGLVELSGHYHPKATLVARGRRLTRRCFLSDAARVILPAFGCYTGGLDARDPVFDPLFSDDALALLCGARAVTPTPRRLLSGRAA